MENLDLRGLVPACVTPFTDDGAVDHEALAIHGRWLAALPGVKGIVCNGHAGEGTSMSEAERTEVIRTLVDAVDGAQPIITGVCNDGSTIAGHEARRYAEAGAAAVLLYPAHSWLRFGFQPGAVLFVCLTWFGHATGWRVGYVVIGVVSVVIGLAAIRLLPESRQWLAYQQRLRAGTLPPELVRTKVPLMDVFRSKLVFGTAVFMVLSTAMFLTTNSVGAYLSTYLLKVQHLSLGTASTVVLFGYIATIIAYSATGALSDLVRRKIAFALSCLFGVIGFGWFLLQVTTHADHVASAFWTSSTFWALMTCAGASGGFGVLGVWMSEFYPTRIRSTGTNGSYYVGRGLGAGVYPLIALALAGSVPIALALGILGPLAGIVFSAVAPDRTGRTITALE